MEAPARNVMPLVPLLIIVGAGLMVGGGVGYLIWSPGASNYAVMSTAEEAVRTVKIDDINVTFPSVMIVKAGTIASLTINLTTSLRSNLAYVSVSLALVQNSGIDADTIGTLTTNKYSVTLASYAAETDTINVQPRSTGYAFFDLIVKGKIAGTIALYVVPS